MLLIGTISFGMEFEIVQYCNHKGGKVWNSKCSENKVCVEVVTGELRFSTPLKYIL